MIISPLRKCYHIVMRKTIIILDSFLVILITLLLVSVFVLTGLGSRYHEVNRFSSWYFFPTLFLILAFQAVMLLLTVIFMVIGLTSTGCRPLPKVYRLARTQMIMRIIQVPFFVVIFIFGCMCLLTIFTFAATFVLAFLDLISIITTGLCSIAVYHEMRKSGLISQNEQVAYSILAFIFCADVVVAIVAFVRARGVKKRLVWDLSERLEEQV